MLSTAPQLIARQYVSPLQTGLLPLPVAMCGILAGPASAALWRRRQPLWQTTARDGSCARLTVDERDIDTTVFPMPWCGAIDFLDANSSSVAVSCSGGRHRIGDPRRSTAAFVATRCLSSARRAGTRGPDTPFPPRAQGCETHARWQGCCRGCQAGDRRGGIGDEIGSGSGRRGGRIASTSLRAEPNRGRTGPGHSHVAPPAPGRGDHAS